MRLALLAAAALGLACVGPLNLASPESRQAHLSDSVHRDAQLRAEAERQQHERDQARAEELDKAYREREDAKAAEVTAAKAASDQEALEHAQAHWSAEEARTESLQKRCGKDFQNIRVGMTWKRAEECAGTEFRRKYQDQHATVYDSEDYAVRVEQGRVTRVLEH